MADISTTITVDNRITDGRCWFQKYGTTKEAAFQMVKKIQLSQLFKMHKTIHLKILMLWI